MCWLWKCWPCPLKPEANEGHGLCFPLRFQIRPDHHACLGTRRDPGASARRRAPGARWKKSGPPYMMFVFSSRQRRGGLHRRFPPRTGWRQTTTSLLRKRPDLCWKKIWTLWHNSFTDVPRRRCFVLGLRCSVSYLSTGAPGK